MATYIEINSAIKKCIDTHTVGRLAIGDGLELRIGRNGKSVWWVRKKRNGKLISKNLGEYPEITLKDAKGMAASFAERLKGLNGLANYSVNQAFCDWSEMKILQVKRREDRLDDTYKNFENIALRFRKHVLKRFGNWNLADLTAQDLIKHWEPLKDENGYATETIRKLCSYVKSIQIFARDAGKCPIIHDLTQLSASFVFRAKEHRPAIPFTELPWLFQKLEQSIRGYGASYNVFLASLYTLCRPGEIACLEWSWCNFDKGYISFPSVIMKKEVTWEVPMSTQLRALLKAQVKTSNRFVFPACRAGKKKSKLVINIPALKEKRQQIEKQKQIAPEDTHINRESVNTMLKKHGMQGIQTAHGLRSLGRSFMAAKRIDPILAEKCIAHKTENLEGLEEYQRYEYIEERRPIMQMWCDYVDACREQALQAIRDGNVIEKNN